ncbi:unnamed protein product [Rotaria socialis]|uniref:Uncharacterized protein n=1 Tax=Rotaria socialis TaxID=392032 RepID=A0A818ZQX0_9BILA|nr:unnamed protein product [Rotaria socialis]CAF4788658.1 unnamed protein product [Rotaria socialis]
MFDIPVDAQWSQKEIIFTGGDDYNDITSKLSLSYGLFINDDDQTMVTTDYDNNRIIQWNMNNTNGQVVAGGNGEGNRLDQLNGPTDVLIDKETDSLIISDSKNRRVVKWSRHDGMLQGEILIDNIPCHGLAMDDYRYLYVSDVRQHEVRRYQLESDMKNGIIVAGGNGHGSDLNQLDFPIYIFVDRQQTIYVSDWNNHRVMKWNKDAKEGIAIAGGQGVGNDLTQLSNPSGLVVDASGTLYVADLGNNRIVCWPKGAEQGTVVAGADVELKWPIGMPFDHHGNYYIVDSANARVLRFSIQ